MPESVFSIDDAEIFCLIWAHYCLTLGSLLCKSRLTLGSLLFKSGLTLGSTLEHFLNSILTFIKKFYCSGYGERKARIDIFH